MTTCLVLGGADCLHADMVAYTGPIDGVVCANDSLTIWSGEVDAAVSLHPRYWDQKGWIKRRAKKGYPDAKAYFGMFEAPDPFPLYAQRTDYRLPGQTHSGSSGLFAAKVALIDLGFDNVVFCGVPMTVTPHYWDRKRENWKAAEGFRRQWLTVDKEYRNRMRSMSGWTRVLLGPPEQRKKLT